MNYLVGNIGVVFASLLLAPSAYAQTRDFGSAGGFDIGGQASTRDKPGSCIASFEYEGPGSTMTVLLRKADPEDREIVYLTVTNFEWSAKEDQTYKLRYVFGDVFYERTAWGVKLDYIYKGFMTGFPAEEFLGAYAKSKSLHIFLGETAVDKLSLAGSAAGVTLFNRCWAWLQGTEREAEAERERYKSIPRDPFAVIPPQTEEIE